MSRSVDVVVPVYGARKFTKACLASVLRHGRGDWRLVVVDDASPDSRLVAYLDRFVARHKGRVVLLRHETNQGFVVSANRGLRHAAGRDVILLNSDTRVTRNFIEKLRACAYENDSTGIVSPLTNNGTICSVPRFMEDNPIPRTFTADQFAALVERVSRKRRPILVTAVGFCMFIRAEVMATIGFFDEENFPYGYGEENDYSERARGAGFDVRLCDDLFVAHEGRASFGTRGADRQIAHDDVMDRLYPDYHERVQDFIRANPMAELHRDLQREIERWQGIGFLRRGLRRFDRWGA